MRNDSFTGSFSYYVSIPDGGKGLDIGCGSGALTIACAKKNPRAFFTGIDRWGKEYASFSKRLCESNSEAEGVSNNSFMQGDACKLSFEDETSLKFEKIIEGMKCQTIEEIEDALKTAGFSEIKSNHHKSKPWITVIARK